MQCPKCRYDGIREAKRKWFDVLPFLVGRAAWRCGGCRLRFYRLASVFAKTPLRKPAWYRKLMNKHARKRHLLREVTILIAALLVFLFFVRFLLVERVSGTAASIGITAA